MLNVLNVSVKYDNIERLSNITLNCEMGKLIGVIGPNGAGKSTFLKALINIVPHAGEVNYQNKPIQKQLNKIAYVEQKSRVDIHFPITVKDFITLGTYYGKGLFQKMTKQRLALVDQAIEQVQLQQSRHKKISELSGGQFQRMMIARALVQNPDVLLLDEPLAGVDKVSEEFIMKLLLQLKEEGKLIIMVHHDLTTIHTYFDELILINKTLVDFGKTDQVFTQNNIMKTYGVLVGGQ